MIKVRGPSLLVYSGWALYETLIPTRIVISASLKDDHQSHVHLLASQLEKREDPFFTIMDRYHWPTGCLKPISILAGISILSFILLFKTFNPFNFFGVPLFWRPRRSGLSYAKLVFINKIILLAITLGILGVMCNGMLSSSDGFEVSLNGVKVWSKKESDNFPTAEALEDIIRVELAGIRFQNFLFYFIAGIVLTVMSKIQLFQKFVINLIFIIVIFNILVRLSSNPK